MALRYEGLGRRYLGLLLCFNCGGGELEADKERVVVVSASLGVKMRSVNLSIKPVTSDFPFSLSSAKLQLYQSGEPFNNPHVRSCRI